MSLNHSVNIERLEKILGSRNWLKDVEGTQFQRDSVKLYADSELKELYAYFLRYNVLKITPKIEMTVTGFSLPTIMIHLWPRENYPVKRFTSLFSGETFKFLPIDRLKEHEQRCHVGWDIHNDGHVGRLVAFLVQNDLHAKPGYWCDARSFDELQGLPALDLMKPVNRNRSTTNLHDLQCDLLSIKVVPAKPPFKYLQKIVDQSEGVFLADLDVDIHFHGDHEDNAYWEIFIGKAQLVIPMPKEGTSFPPHLQLQRTELLNAMTQEEAIANMDDEIARLLLETSSDAMAETQANWATMVDQTDMEETVPHAMFKYHDLNREFKNLDQFGPISNFLETLTEAVFKYHDIGGGKVAHERLLKDIRKLTKAYESSFKQVAGTESEALNAIVHRLKDAVKKFVHIDHLMNQLSVFLNLYAYPSRWYRFETDSVCILITRKHITFRRIELPDHKVLAECKFSVVLPNTDEKSKRAPGQRGVFFKDNGRTVQARNVTGVRLYDLLDRLGSVIAIESGKLGVIYEDQVSMPRSPLNQAIHSVLSTMFADVKALVKNADGSEAFLSEYKNVVYMAYKERQPWDLLWSLLSPFMAFYDNADIKAHCDSLDKDAALELSVNTGWYRFTLYFIGALRALKVEVLLDGKQQKTLVHVDVTAAKPINEENGVREADEPVAGTTLGDQFPELRSILKKTRPSVVSSAPVEEGRQVIPDKSSDEMTEAGNSVEDELEETPLIKDLEKETPVVEETRSADGTKGVTSTIYKDADLPQHMEGDSKAAMADDRPHLNVLKHREVSEPLRPHHVYDPLLHGQPHADDGRSVWPSMLPPGYSGQYGTRAVSEDDELRETLDTLIDKENSGAASTAGFANTPKASLDGQGRVAPVRSMGESDARPGYTTPDNLETHLKELVNNRASARTAALETLIERFDKLVAMHLDVRNYKTLEGTRVMLTDSILTTLLTTISSHAGYELAFLDKGGFVSQEGRQENADSVILLLPMKDYVVMVPFVNQSQTDTLYCN